MLHLGVFFFFFFFWGGGGGGSGLVQGDLLCLAFPRGLSFCFVFNV